MCLPWEAHRPRMSTVMPICSSTCPMTAIGATGTASGATGTASGLPELPIFCIFRPVWLCHKLLHYEKNLAHYRGTVCCIYRIGPEVKRLQRKDRPSDRSRRRYVLPGRRSCCESMEGTIETRRKEIFHSRSLSWLYYE